MSLTMVEIRLLNLQLKKKQQKNPTQQSQIFLKIDILYLRVQVPYGPYTG